MTFKKDIELFLKLSCTVDSVVILQKFPPQTSLTHSAVDQQNPFKRYDDEKENYFDT